MWNGPGEPAIGQGNPILLVHALHLRSRGTGLPHMVSSWGAGAPWVIQESRPPAECLTHTEAALGKPLS